MEIVIHRVVQGDLQELQPYLLLGWSSQANLGLACKEQTPGRTLCPCLRWAFLLLPQAPEKGREESC